METEIAIKPDPDYSICFSCEARFYTGGHSRRRCYPCEKAHTGLVVSEIEAKKTLSIEQNVVALIKNKKRIFFFRWMLLWFLVGSCYAFYNREHDKHGCVYRSVGSIINPGYVIGCEIFRERFEIGK